MNSKNQSPIFPNKKEITTLGAGCFWCSEAVFSELKGVEKVESGYSGGTILNPTYDHVCTGKTGHAEVVQVTFDPTILPFKDLLQFFFTVHDPTTLNRQGADVGTQYRSVIFYHTGEQKAIAEQVIKKINESKLYDTPIVTQVEPFKAFFKAEEYHQKYFKQNTSHPYCRVVIAPKVAKIREYYQKKLKNYN